MAMGRFLMGTHGGRKWVALPFLPKTVANNVAL
jgi:hypothetical protein